MDNVSLVASGSKLVNNQCQLMFLKIILFLNMHTYNRFLYDVYDKSVIRYDSIQLNMLSHSFHYHQAVHLNDLFF